MFSIGNATYSIYVFRRHNPLNVTDAMGNMLLSLANVTVMSQPIAAQISFSLEFIIIVLNSLLTKYQAPENQP